MLGLFHITQEGAPYSLGLNFWIHRKNKPYWFRLVWVWAEPDGRCRYWYFRFRCRMRPPYFLFDYNEWNVVDQWLFNSHYVVITREDYEDWGRNQVERPIPVKPRWGLLNK